MEKNVEKDHKYYFALTLKDSANHLPTIIDNLLRVIYHVGEQNVFMSIYEGGSTDDGHTTAMIEPIKATLEAIGVQYHITIEATPTSYPKDVALEPLKTMYRSAQRTFNTIVMMEDDLWCAEEFLELLLRSRADKASITCSSDIRARANVYSITPGHDINGKLFRQVILSIDNTHVYRGKLVHTLKIKSPLPDFVTTILYESKPVSPQLQSLTQHLSTLLTTSPSSIPIQEPRIVDRLGKTIVNSPLNSTLPFAMPPRDSTELCSSLEAKLVTTFSTFSSLIVHKQNWLRGSNCINNWGIGSKKRLEENRVPLQKISMSMRTRTYFRYPRLWPRDVRFPCVG